jgi:DNA modification methylase
VIRILQGDCRDVLATLLPASVQCCVTSPPYYGLRDYGVAGQIGLEPSPAEYVAEMVAVFAAVRRVLLDDGCVFLNLGDSYAAGGMGPGSGKQLTNVGANIPRKVAPVGFKPKDLLGIPWMVAFALRADGWYLRSDIIWHKPNPMPESVTDRPTSAHEHVFLLTKNSRYFYDADAIKEPVTDDMGRRAEAGHTRGQGKVDASRNDGATVRPTVITGGTRNARNVWTIATQPFSGAHFATMPPELAERCVKAGSKTGDTILDPFSGAGTTALVASRLGRNAIGIELNPAYAKLAENRVHDDCPMFSGLDSVA